MSCCAVQGLSRNYKGKKGKWCFYKSLYWNVLFWFLGALMKNGNKEIKEEFIQSAYEQGGDLPSVKKNGSLIT